VSFCVADLGPAPLQVIGLAKRYRRRRAWALADIDLSFREGTITALVGPNGAGKSTLLRTLMGFEKPTRGQALVMGMDVSRHRADALRHVGYVGQEATLYRDLSVADHIAMAAALRRGFDSEGARLRLGALGIPLSARGGELSGGQRVQVALAIAVGTRAPILLLDEPVASLDPMARQDFLALLATTVRPLRATVVIASHIVGELEGVCDDIVVLAPGRVMLHDAIAHARATHVLSPAGTTIHPDAVATFDRPDQSRVSLLRVANGGTATLDDLVLGYLNAARRREPGT
jgi:ABC-2 type transport system ATP-binding protein